MPTKVIYSGICMCGHSWDRHHLCMIMDEAIIKEVDATSFPDECLAYGSNEYGGLDEDGNLHCGNYVDRENPDSSARNKWYGTVRT